MHIPLDHPHKDTGDNYIINRMPNSLRRVVLQGVFLDFLLLLVSSHPLKDFEYLSVFLLSHPLHSNQLVGGSLDLSDFALWL